jgi:hypothetical protein
MKPKRIPGVKGVYIGNRLVAMTDAEVRDLVKKTKKVKRGSTA